MAHDTQVETWISECIRYLSGVTFNRYVHSQKMEEPLVAIKPKSKNMIAKYRQRFPMPGGTLDHSFNQSRFNPFDRNLKILQPQFTGITKTAKMV